MAADPTHAMKPHEWGTQIVGGPPAVAEDEELVSLAEGLECVREDRSGVVVVQIWESVVTTEGDEVVVAFGLITFRRLGMRWWCFRVRRHRTPLGR